jgi:hypothetical protein
MSITKLVQKITQTIYFHPCKVSERPFWRYIPETFIREQATEDRDEPSLLEYIDIKTRIPLDALFPLIKLDIDSLVVKYIRRK